MRRILLIAFVLVFLSESSGIGLAVEQGGPAYRGSLLADLRNAISGFAQSPLLAMVSAPDRYAAMHAPPPDFNHPIPRPSVLAVINRYQGHGTAAVGVPIKPPQMILQPMVPNRAPKDPSAMAGSTSMVSRGVTAARTVTPLMRSRRSQSVRPMVTPLAPSTTGIKRWWTYEADPIPGVGNAMVNVANGNLIVQSDDVDISERGIDLAYRRTYNSQSTHDWNNSDGSVPSSFGEGWTSTFDAHLSYDSANNILSVWDNDGARYDYTSDGNGNWVAPAGQHATLAWDGHCGYQWTKKTGTMYYFVRPDYSTFSGCMGPPGYNGRLVAIYSRNWNNQINLTYSWIGGDASTAANLSQIIVAHSDGQQLTLTFGYWAGSQRELLSITRPDGKTISYSYDASGNLGCVTEIGNNVATTLIHCYYYQNGHQLFVVQNPRLLYTYGLNGNSVQEGDEIVAGYNASNQISQLYHWGAMNFTPGTYQYPSDGTNAVLQPGVPTGGETWHVSNFSGYGSGTVSLTDTDGHATNWVIDSVGRATQTSEWNGSIYLVTTDAWDSANNLIETTDTRGNPTDYAYDDNGNTIAEALPTVSTNQGTLRPTSLYSYDARNNVTAYCDPTRVGASGYDWTNRPKSDTLCTGSCNATHFCNG